jgi:hypothetical protein
MFAAFCYSGGVNSTALALEIALGYYPAPDVAINLPTDADDRTTREGAAIAADLLRAVNIPCFTLAKANILAIEAAACNPDTIGPQPPPLNIPLHYAAPGGARGNLRRQCTRRYKTRPLRAALRAISRAIHTHTGTPHEPAEFWLGFSTDEPMRCRQPEEHWLRHRFPLIELGHSRPDCRAILDAHGYHHVIRSSCLMCPYRAQADWAAMRSHNPDAFELAARYDELIRDARPAIGQLYVHRSRRPLRDAVSPQPLHDPDIRGT